MTWSESFRHGIHDAHEQKTSSAFKQSQEKHCDLGSHNSVPGKLQLDPHADSRCPPPKLLAMQISLQRNLTSSREISTNPEASWSPSQFAEEAKAPFNTCTERLHLIPSSPAERVGVLSINTAATSSTSGQSMRRTYSLSLVSLGRPRGVQRDHICFIFK